MRKSQKAAGRLPRQVEQPALRRGELADVNKVVEKDNRVLIGIAMLFLGVCLVNVVGLLLAKFMNGAALTGLRRALGASRRDIVRQHLTEVLLIGLAGGVLGLLLAMAGLAGIRSLYTVGAYESEAQVYDPADQHRLHGRAGDPGSRVARGPAGRALSRVAHRPHGAGRLPEIAVRS